MKYLLLVLLALTTVSCGSSPVSVAKVSSRDMVLQDYFWRFLINTPEERTRILFSTDPLKPLPSDIAVYETDLNEDGRPDFIASVIHFKYFEKDSYPVYIMMQNEYNAYVPILLEQRSATFDVKVLPERTLGMQNIVIDGKTLVFNGKTYGAGL